MVMPRGAAGNEAGHQDRAAGCGVHIKGVGEPGNSSQPGAGCPRGGVAIADALLQVHPRTAIDGQQFNARLFAAIQAAHDDLAASAVEREVARRLAYHDGKASSSLLIQAKLAGKQSGLPPGFAHLALVVHGDADALGQSHFHRVIATRVPSPTGEEISKSFTSRLEPLKPRPRPEPVV